MNYNKRLEIRLSSQLKSIIKFYHKDYSSIIRSLLITYFEGLNKLNSDDMFFYNETKHRIPEYFEFSKTIGFDDSFDLKFKKKFKNKINTLHFIGKLYEDLEFSKKIEKDLIKHINSLETKLKQYENSKG